jgi:signal transduction histidine kinase
MSIPGMHLYKSLSTIGFLKKSYAMKFLFIAFLGIHIPLIGIVLFVGFAAPDSISPLTILLLTLSFTLAATAATLFVLNKLLNPVRLAELSLLEYLTNKKIPELPIDFKDEIGSLLHSILHTVESLEQANKIKEEMMHTITHDLRSPLAQIILLSELLQNGGIEAGEFAELVRSGAQMELDFIDNYIAVLESDDHKELFSKNTKIGLLELVEQSLKMLDMQMRNKQLQLHIDIAPDLYMYTTKELLFEHVIRNLLSNAIKFSYPDGVIEISAVANATHTELSVKDSGMGFLPQHAEGLFAKFTSCKRLGTLGESTKGIGLYLAKEIVKQHGGTIAATSEGADKGATFTVTFINS